MTGLSGCAVAEAAEEGVSVQLRLLCLEQRAEKARALRVDASAVHAARLERAVAPESLCDEDTQTGDGPMVPAVGWASSWTVVQVACKEKGLELVGFLWFEVGDRWRCRDAARCHSFLDVGRETSAGCQKQSRRRGQRPRNTFRE